MTSCEVRIAGILCQPEPHIGANIRVDGEQVGKVTAGAISPYLKQGIGIALMNQPDYLSDTAVMVGSIDGEFHDGKLAELPLYDKQGEIQRGKCINIPKRDYSRAIAWNYLDLSIPLRSQREHSLEFFDIRIYNGIYINHELLVSER